MKVYLTALILVGLVVGCSTTTNSDSLLEFNSSEFGDAGNHLQIREIERNPKTSVFRFTSKGKSDALADGIFFLYALYEAATIRGTEYIFLLKEQEMEDDTTISIVGFTNQKNPDIQKEFGKEFSSLDDSGKPRESVSVLQLKHLPERVKKNRVQQNGTTRP